MTVFPNEIQTFPTMLNMEAADGAAMQEFQAAMEEGDLAKAETALQSITNANQKLLSATLLNNIIDTCTALQQYYLEKYSPAYIVSANEPAGQALGDFWFKVE